MKKLIYSLLLLTILFSCKKDEDNTDNTGTKKDIASITETDYYGVLKNGIIQKDKLYERRVTNFDVNEWTNDITYYRSDGQVREIDTYKYAANNFTLNIDDKEYSSQTFKGIVNENGNRLNCDAYYDSETKAWGKYTWTYDINGFLIEETIIENNISWTYKTTIENDKDGNPIKAYYSENGLQKETYTFEYKTYDSKGNWTYRNEICTNSDGSKDYSITEREITYR